MAKNFGRVNVSVTASTGGLTAGLARASKQVKSFAASVGTAMRGVAAPLLVLASVGTAFAAFGKAAHDLDAMGEAANRLGMTTASLQALSAVAGQSGVETGQLTQMLTLLSRKIGDAGAGSKSAANAFARVGVTLSMLQGLDPAAQFTLISQKIMELPTAAERSAAAMAIFGRSGATGLNLIEAAANGATERMRTLQAQLGVSITDEQKNGIDMMNDSWGETSMIVQGFINQLVAGVAPAITTMSNLLVNFFSQNTQGWTLAQMAAGGFSFVLKALVGTVTFFYGVLQVIAGFWAVFGAAGFKAFELVLNGIGLVLQGLEQLLSTLPGIDLGLQSAAASAADYVQSLADAAGVKADVAVDAGKSLIGKGAENMRNPLGAYNAEMAKVMEQMAAAGQQAGKEFGKAATPAIASAVPAAVRASSEALKAMVVGTSEAESFRNKYRSGYDPRAMGDAEDRTADATERTADGIEDLNDSLADIGLGLATIAV